METITYKRIRAQLSSFWAHSAQLSSSLQWGGAQFQFHFFGGLWHIKLMGLTPSWTTKWKKWVLGSWVRSRAQKGVLGGPLGGSIAQSHETYLLWHIKLKDLPHLWRLKWKKWVLGPWVHPRPRKWVFGPIEGSHFTKSPNIPIVIYQIKGFASLMNIKKKKMGFGTLGPLQAPKIGFWAHWGVPISKVSKHTYCDISN